ncbi:MAG: hypothetical protein ACR2GQ_06790 [Gemmatimonadota bacterium]
MSFSVFDRLLAGKDGALWVRRITSSDSKEHRWEGFEPDGSRRAAITLPAGFDVREAGQRFLVAIAPPSGEATAGDETPVVLYDFQREKPAR